MSGYDDIDNTPMSETERRIRRQVRSQADFYKHAMSYVGVISLLWFICLATLPSGSFAAMLSGEGVKWWRFWAIWPTLGWGIGLFFHAMSVLPAFARWGADWEERKVEELMARSKRGG
jgi:hypothetical protein